MHVLSLKIIDLAGRAGYQLDRLDLEITITEAMNEDERADLGAMIDFLAGHNEGASYIMEQIGHDLIGYKQRKLKAPAAEFFTPRSYEFKTILKKWRSNNEQASANQPSACR